MKGLIQRVSAAKLEANGDFRGAIGNGLVLFLAVESQDTKQTADKLLNKILGYRVFEDNDGKMNVSLLDARAGLMVVSQFTLAASTQKGLRPSFSSAADPALGEALYDYFLEQAKRRVPGVVTGLFGADMLVDLQNRGPVTFMLSV